MLGRSDLISRTIVIASHAFHMFGLEFRARTTVIASHLTCFSLNFGDDGSTLSVSPGPHVLGLALILGTIDGYRSRVISCLGLNFESGGEDSTCASRSRVWPGFEF